jgi:hypothetical protein
VNALFLTKIEGVFDWLFITLAHHEKKVDEEKAVLKNAELYDFTQNFQGNLFMAAMKHYKGELPERPALLNLRRGFAESPSWMMIQMIEFAPEGMTVEKFRRRAVYSSPNLSLAMLELLASEGWLDRKGNDYHLTEAGKAEAQKIRQNRIRIFEGFEPIEPAETARLVHLIACVIDACLNAKSPDNWCLRYSRNRAPLDSDSTGAKLMQFGSDFNAYRDDSHMAAYGHHGVEGHIWEAFSLIADGKAKNVADLYAQLAYRGFYSEDWQAALDDLSQRAWIEEGQVTEKGRKVREAVEAQTNDYFFAPWDVLSAKEFEEMLELMQKYDNRCQELLK